MKPILAIDIDEVLSETNRYVLPLFTKEHGLCISYEEVTDHWLPNLPMCTLDGPTTIQSYRRFMNYPESHVGCIPVLGALEGLKKL